VSDYELGFPNEDDTFKNYSHVQYYAPEMCGDITRVNIIDLKPKADVWSYGMLLCTLFTYPDQNLAEPFANLKDLDAVKQEIKNLTDEKIKALFGKIPSKTLQELLLDCCRASPKQRLSFEQLEEKYDSNKEDDLFSKILQEMDNTAAVINKIWNDAISNKVSSTQQGFEFAKFLQFLTNDCFKLKRDTEGYHYLLQALRLPYWLRPNDDNPKSISREQFEKVCKLFKFTKEDEQSNYQNFIKRIVDLFSQKYFYGSVQRETVQVALDKKNTIANWWAATIAYVVRYSQQGQFCVTFKNKNVQGGFEHATIDPTAALNAEGYSSYIKKYKKSLQKNRKINLKTDKIDLEKAYTTFESSKK